MRNYGVLACGETIEEAWYLILNCVCACEIQSRVLSSCGGNIDSINLLTDEQKKVFADAKQFNELTISNEQRKWKVGELEFEACMRSLDNAVSINTLSKQSLMFISVDCITILTNTTGISNRLRLSSANNQKHRQECNQRS